MIQKGYSSALKSKADPSTQCQKCLKRDMYLQSPFTQGLANYSVRHFSYECTATPQERPYATRPSRTQQLKNRKLVPKLASDTVNPLTIR